jgi:hypothetical protein
MVVAVFGALVAEAKIGRHILLQMHFVTLAGFVTPKRDVTCSAHGIFSSRF